MKMMMIAIVVMTRTHIASGDERAFSAAGGASVPCWKHISLRMFFSQNQPTVLHVLLVLLLLVDHYGNAL